MYPRQIAEKLSEALSIELKALRLSRNLSMNETATRAGLAVSFVFDIEKGNTRASVETLVKLAWAYGTSASDILKKCEQIVEFSPSDTQA